MTPVQLEIEKYRDGLEFDGTIAPFVSSGRPDPKAIELLAAAMHEDMNKTLREQCAKALIEIGTKTDLLYEQSVPILRDKKIVSVLVNPGLEQLDGARGLCVDALKDYTPAALLKDHARALVQNLGWWPDDSMLLLIAKFKPVEAKPVLEKLSKSDQWKESESMLIARASLGETAITEKFARAYHAEQDPREKARLAHVLGYIGTKQALTELSADLRTDLVIEIVSAFRKSVRCDILESLAYNFPDQAFLYPDNVHNDDDYAKVEKFCEEHFGVRYTTPRPEFLTLKGLPRV